MSKPKFNFEGIKPAFFGGGLKAFIQTVLPTIYDDSLSYYELLNKVVKHLNNMGEAVETLDENQELFFAAVTKYINENATETYDIVLDNTFTTLSDEEVNELYQAISDNKIVRVIVKDPVSGNQYTCYYASYDRSTVDDNTKNDLYFMGYPIRRFDDATRFFDMRVIKIEHDTGYVTAYSDHKIPTKAYVDNSVAATELRLLDEIDEIDAKTGIALVFDVVKEDSAYTMTSNLTPGELKNLVDADNDSFINLQVNVDDRDDDKKQTIFSGGIHDYTDTRTNGRWFEIFVALKNPVEYTDVGQTLDGFELKFTSFNDTTWGIAERKTIFYKYCRISCDENNGAISNIESEITPRELYDFLDSFGFKIPYVFELVVDDVNVPVGETIYRTTSAVSIDKGDGNPKVKVVFADNINRYTLIGDVNRGVWTCDKTDEASGGVFIAVRGTTTSTEIRNAYEAGKVVICIYQERMYYLSSLTDNTSEVSLSSVPDTQGNYYVFIVNGSNWIRAAKTVAFSEQIPTDYVSDTVFGERTDPFELVMSYSNGTVALEHADLPLSNLIRLVLNSCNVWFLLPTYYITGIQSNTDMIRFLMTGANMDMSSPTVSLATLYNGKIYYTTLAPVSDTRMEGALTEKTL